MSIIMGVLSSLNDPLMLPITCEVGIYMRFKEEKKENTLSTKRKSKIQEKKEENMILTKKTRKKTRS